jgi:hypothetical protein
MIVNSLKRQEAAARCNELLFLDAKRTRKYGRARRDDAPVPILDEFDVVHEA